MNFRPDVGGGKRWVTTALDITPLVDVVFLLLVFFFYAAQIQKTRSISVNLPRSSAKASKTKTQDKQVSIRADGTIYYEGTKTDLKSLESQLRLLARTSPDSKLLIRSDAASQVGRLVKVMNLAKEANIRRVGIVTRGKKKGN